MDDNQTINSRTPYDLVTFKARSTHAYLNHAPDDLNEMPLDTKLLVPAVDINTQCMEKLPLLQCSGNTNDKDNAIPYKYSEVIQSASQIILNTNETHSCNIFKNKDDAQNPICNNTLNANKAETELLDVNTNYNCPFSSSEDGKCFCNRYSISNVDELLNGCYLNDHAHPSISGVRSSVSSDSYYSSRESLSSDSKSDGIVTFLDRSNIEVRDLESS